MKKVLSLIPFIHRTISQSTTSTPPTTTPLTFSSTLQSSELLCCDCTVPTPTIAGCSADPECEAFICAATDTVIRDPLCCDIAWDSQCAQAAAAECPLTTTTTNAPLCCS